MTLPILILYFIYPIVGLCTLYILQRLKMKIAYRVYLVAFLMIFLYLPVYGAFGMLGGIEAFGSKTVYFEMLRAYVIDPLNGAENGMILSNCIVIAISAFLCISAAGFTLTTIRVIRKIRFYRPRSMPMPKQAPVSPDTKKAFPKRNLCHLYCRYTC